MNRESDEWKKNLSPEERERLVLPQLEIYTSLAGKKMGVLPQMAALAATLIAILTLNENLLLLGSVDGKLLLSVFIALVPITLHIFLLDVEGGANNSLKIIKSYMHTDLDKAMEKHKTVLAYVTSYSPWVVLSIFYLATFYLVFRIWWL